MAKQQAEKQQQQQSQEQQSSGRSPSVDSRSSGSSYSDMRIEKTKVGKNQLVPILERANAFGTRGKPVKVEVNFIRLLLDRMINVAYHYDVAFEPERPKKFFRPVFAQFCRENIPGVRFAYDGQKSAYSSKKIKDQMATVKFAPSDGGKAMEFKVTIKWAADVDLSSLKNYMSQKIGLTKPMSAIQCLDVVLRTAYENNNKFIRFKRSAYAVPSQKYSLGKGHELFYGLFQSAILGSKPYINVDVSHKAFPSGGELLAIMAEFCRGSTPTSYEQQEIHNYLKGMDVIYRNPKGLVKRMRCNGLKLPANTQRFKLDNGKETTVADYFRSLGAPLRYPEFPVLHVGSTVRNVCVPAEFCAIPPGQALNKKHPDECTAAIIKKSATNTMERKNKIMDLLSQIQYNQSPTVQDFGVSVNNAFENIDARIIDAPMLQYSGNQVVAPAKLRGVWRADDKSFIVPSTQLTKRALVWRIVNLDQSTREGEIEQFGRMLQQYASKCGIAIEPFSMGTTLVLVRNQRDCIRDLSNIFTTVKKQQPDITIVIIPSRGPDVYAKVKQKAELASENIGLLTQCIKGFTVLRKGSDISTIQNILLKINAKTNGSNHHITGTTTPPAFRNGVMYIGGDVTHFTDDNLPSVVGMAASYDLQGVRYNFSMRLQGARDEMIRDLENIVIHQLQQFRRHNGAFPVHIMYYRDGVSDGQFGEILTIELTAMRAACAKVQPEYKPNITFVVVQKRHHTRFFPDKNCPSEGRNNNVPPGTIVDRDITAPNRYEFYLVSHAAVQGVAKPSKYVVLHDDANCNPDQLQALTYNLCHIYVRCNRAVSYPAPTYYAHHIAYRGRALIKDRRIEMENLEQECKNLMLKSDVVENHPMFFV